MAIGGQRWSMVAVNDGRLWRTIVDHRRTTVDHHRSTVVDRQLNVGSWAGSGSGRHVAHSKSATSSATSACWSHVSPRRSATSADWVPHVHVATTSAADVAEGIYNPPAMGDENPIRTLGDYSRPSHKGYRNTTELLAGNNMVPLQSDTIRLVQNGCSFHGLWSEDPNQHLKDFLKLVDSLDLNGENKERTRLHKVRKLEEYMHVIGSDFMQLSLEVVEKLREEIRIEQNRTKKIKKITRESNFGFKPGTKYKQNTKSRHDAENLSLQSTPQDLPSFEVYTPTMTYLEKVEETLGTPIKVEPLDETQLENLGSNACNHSTFLVL
nr:zinc finger, CCHC-type [Tanacetum cinerariifolium]